jgi:hypothetical protein
MRRKNNRDERRAPIRLFWNMPSGLAYKQVAAICTAADEAYIATSSARGNRLRRRLEMQAARRQRGAVKRDMRERRLALDSSIAEYVSEQRELTGRVESLAFRQFLLDQPDGIAFYGEWFRMLPPPVEFETGFEPFTMSQMKCGHIGGVPVMR